jgi:Tol biopolymer transport system component
MIPGDASSIQVDGPPADVAPPTMCLPTTPFVTVSPVAGLATSGIERTPSLSPDELTAYFTGAFAGAASQDLYAAHRPTTTAAFGTPAPITAANTSDLEFAPTISADELTLLFTSSRVAGQGYHLYVSTRPTTLADFGVPAPLGGGIAAATVTANDTQPFVVADGQELWFASDRSGVYALMRAARTGAMFTNPTVVSDLSFAEGSQFPVVSPDRRSVYFATPRTQAGTKGGFDIWTATRASPTDPLSAPVVVSELNSASAETPGWLSADNCRLYFESDRSGTWDIYVATRAVVR